MGLSLSSCQSLAFGSAPEMALRIADLKKDYIAPDGTVVPVIDIAQLSVADGEHVALIGTSGSGKTTLLHMIAGIVAADSGSIIYDLTGLRPPAANPATDAMPSK